MTRFDLIDWQTFEEIHILGVLAARVFDGNDIVGGLVTLDAWVGVAAEPDKAVLASQHKLCSVDDGDVEAFTVRRHTVSDGVQTAVHTGRDVATVGRTQGYRPVQQPIDTEQPARWPVPQHNNKIQPERRSTTCVWRSSTWNCRSTTWRGRLVSRLLVVELFRSPARRPGMTSRKTWHQQNHCPHFVASSRHTCSGSQSI